MNVFDKVPFGRGSNQLDQRRVWFLALRAAIRNPDFESSHYIGEYKNRADLCSTDLRDHYDRLQQLIDDSRVIVDDRHVRGLHKINLEAYLECSLIDWMERNA